MFCFQCQETAKNEACTVKGVCGKPEETADLQDLLIYVCKGISLYGEMLAEQWTYGGGLFIDNRRPWLQAGMARSLKSPIGT